MKRQAKAQQPVRASCIRPSTRSRCRELKYDLLTIIMDFPSGAGVPRHIHGGSVLVTVLSGEITLKEKGGEMVKKTGESWTEKPGDEHAVVNAGTATVRVVVTMLLPKGAEATTVVK